MIIGFAICHTFQSPKYFAEKMGFLIGGSCFAPSPTLHSRFLPFPSSPSPSQCVLLCSSNVVKFKRLRPPSASLRREDGKDDDASVKRRAFLLVGISVLPFLQFRSPAMADESEFFGYSPTALDVY